MVASARTWYSAMCWLSPTWCVARHGTRSRRAGRRAVRMDAARMCARSATDGSRRCASSSSTTRTRRSPTPRSGCARPPAGWPSRTAPAACGRIGGAGDATRADADGVAAYFAIASSTTIGGLWAVTRPLMCGPPSSGSSSSTPLRGRTLAVRGERLQLATARWSNDAGYETELPTCHRDRRRRPHQLLRPLRRGRLRGCLPRARSALLRRRGRGIRRSRCHGRPSGMIALNQGDLDRLFGELTAPGLRFEMRSTLGFSASARRRSFAPASRSSTHGRLGAGVALGGALAVADCVSSASSARPSGWTGSSTHGLASHVSSSARAGSHQAVRVRTRGRGSGIRLRRGAGAGRRQPAVTDKSGQPDVGRRSCGALQARDADAAAACFAEPFVYDDRRRLGGNPIEDVRTANERILAQYTHFEGRTLAVRGERLHLGWTRWSNDVWIRDVLPDRP